MENACGSIALMHALINSAPMMQKDLNMKANNSCSVDVEMVKSRGKKKASFNKSKKTKKIDIPLYEDGTLVTEYMDRVEGVMDPEERGALFNEIAEEAAQWMHMEQEVSLYFR